VDGGGGCSPGDGGSVVRRTVPATRAAVYQRGLGPRAALHALRSAPLDDPGDRRVTLSECPTDQGRARACTARITDASCNAPGLESPGALASRAGLTASTTTPRAVARAPRCRHPDLSRPKPSLEWGFVAQGPIGIEFHVRVRGDEAVPMSEGATPGIARAAPPIRTPIDAQSKWSLTSFMGPAPVQATTQCDSMPFQRT
jgi:hypothetical protein